MTKCDQRHQNPRSSSVPSTIRFGITRTELIRGPSSASIAGRNVIAAQHGDDGDQEAADPDRADHRDGEEHHREQPDRDRRAGHDDRTSGVRHRLDERGLGIGAVA